MVSANIVAARNARIGDRVKPYTILDVGGQKIGIVGAITNDADVISSQAALCSWVEALTCCAAEAWPSAVRAMDWSPLAALAAASAFRLAALVTPPAATRARSAASEIAARALSISRDTVSISATRDALAS